MADQYLAKESDSRPSQRSRGLSGRRPFSYPSDEAIEKAQRGLPMKREPYNPLTANPIPQGSLRAFVRAGQPRGGAIGMRLGLLCVVLVIGAVLII